MSKFLSGVSARRLAFLGAFITLFAFGFIALPTRQALAADTVSSAVYQDTNNDGSIDNIRWTMAENVATCPFESGDWSVPQAGTVVVASVTGLTCTGSDAFLDIAVTAAVDKTGGATNPQLSYTDQGATHVTLAVAGNMGAHANQAATDDAAPVVVSVVNSRDGAPGAYYENKMTIVYSESMTNPIVAPFGDTTTAGVLTGFGTFSTGNITVPTARNGIGHASATYIIKFAAWDQYGYYNTGSTIELGGTFTPVTYAGMHESFASHKLVNTARTVTVTSSLAWDLTPPTITSITLADASGNNGKIDRATVVFSESIGNMANADTTLGNQAGIITWSGDLVTGTFNLTSDAAMPVDTSTNTIRLNYSATTGEPIFDSAGNLLATATPGVVVDGDNAGKLVDGASPVLTAVTTTVANSRNVINFTYSEAMTADTAVSTVNLGDLTSAGTVAGMGDFATNGAVTAVTLKNSISGSGTSTITVTLAGAVGGYLTAGSATVPSGNVTPLAHATLHDAVSLTVNTSAAVVASSPGTAWELTQPTLTSVTISDADYDGRVDTAAALFSLAMRDANVTAANATLGAAATALTGTANDATLTFFYATDNLAVNTTATAADFLYSGATTLLTDLYGNLLDAAADGIIATGIVEVDGAQPVIISTTPASGATGVSLSTNIVADFSEPIAMATCVFASSPTAAGFGDITAGANWGIGASGLANTLLTLTHSTNYNRHNTITITISGCTAATGGAAMHANAAIDNPWSFVSMGSGTGSGGGSSVSATPSVTVVLPNGGNTLTGASVVAISWTSADGAFVKYRVSYSSDNGNSYSAIADNVTNTSFSWIVPTASTSQGLIKVEGIDSSGTVLASDTSNAVFAVAGTTVAPAPVAPPTTTVAPAVDPTVHGSYEAATAKANNPTIADDKGIVAVTNANCTAGSLIKSASLRAVYYCGADGKRYVFVNDKAYLSWYSDFSTVQTVSDATLASITIGGNITYRPGSRMVKIVSDPKVYAVARGGVLRWVASEAVAVRLYGAAWNTMIDDVPDSFFVNYTLGEPITE